MEVTVSELLRCNRVVDYYFLCKNDRIKRAKRYRRWKNRMGTYKRKGYEEMPYKKPKKYKKYKKSKGTPVHQRLVAVGGAGTRYREKKNNDVDPGSLSPAPGVATFSTPLLLNGIATGDDGTTRDGRKILTKSILVRWQLINDADETAGGNVVRIVLVYDKQANNAAPAVTDIFTENNVLSTNNLNNADRFVILKDKLIGPGGGFSVGPKMGVFSVKTQMETLYGLNTDVIGAINSGSIWMLAAFDGTTTEAVGTLNMRIRLRFVDV